MAIFEYKMPELGEGLHEGEIVKWHIKPGDTVNEDDILMEVQNDKAVVEVPSPVQGTIKEVKVSEGTVAVIGDVLILIEVEGDAPASASPAEEAKPEQAPAAAVAAPAAVSAPASAAAIAQSEDNKLILATPSVRKLAREQGISLGRIVGTGKNGRITREDVLTYTQNVTNEEAVEAAASVHAATEPVVSAPSAAPSAPAASGAEEEERVPLKGIRRAIANAMVKSVYTAPHVTIMDEVDVTKLVALRQQLKPLAEQRGVKLTYLPFIVKALVAAVRKYPVLNASIDDERQEIVYKKNYHVGIATDTDNGLLVPVVANADRKSILTIADDIRDLAVRAREGKLAPHEMRGSTISITNIGSAGGMFFTPVINWPEVAILGTGRISEKPVVRDGALAVGQVMALSLSFDHRIIDGATAQYAVNHIKQLLEDPQMFIMEV